MEDQNTLEPEILDNIKSFSGSPDEMSAGERILSEGKALQRTQTAYTTAVAVQKPRSFTRFVNNCMEEAKLAGSAFYYRWEVFDKNKGRKVPIEGESIDMSMCLARNFGNDVVDVEVSETLTHYLFKGVFIDVETGFTAPRLFRQRKSQNISNKMDSDRQEDIVFQIGQSKAIRNAIVRAMPKWLRDQMIDTAKQAELNKIKPENIHLARAKVMDFFSRYGISQERIEKERDKKADEWGPQDIVDLRGMATAIKDGRISAEELFPVEEKKQPELNTNPEYGNGNEAVTFDCPHCDFQSLSERGLKKHITQSHFKTEEPKELDPEPKSDIIEWEEFMKQIDFYTDELGLSVVTRIHMTPPYNVKELSKMPPLQRADLLKEYKQELDRQNSRV